MKTIQQRIEWKKNSKDYKLDDLENKVAQMMRLPYVYMTKEQALEWVEHGIGSFLHILGEDAREPQKLAVEKGKNPAYIWNGRNSRTRIERQSDRISYTAFY